MNKFLMFTFAGVALCFSLGAKADNADGRALFTVRPLYNGGQYFIEVRQEGNKVLGQTFIRQNSMVSLTLDKGLYTGASGGPTKVTCATPASSTPTPSAVVSVCDGFVSGYPFHVQVEKATELMGDGNACAAMKATGYVNMNGFTLMTCGDSVALTGMRGNLTLKKQKDGLWRGQGSNFLPNVPNSPFDATLEWSGSLEDLNMKDTVLFTILFVTPFAR